VTAAVPLDIRPATPADAAAVRDLLVAAVEDPGPGEAPPVEAVAHTLAARPGLLAVDAAGRPVAALCLVDESDRTSLSCLAVPPTRRRQGIGSALVAAAEHTLAADGREAAWVSLRAALTDVRDFWARRGYVEMTGDGREVELAKPLPCSLVVPTAADMTTLGCRLAGSLHAGDLVVLSGDLGAGKTTLTAGLGAGLGVRGPVTSPTFVIARVHPSVGAGPALVHVDAYRLSSFAEVEDLDLEASLADSVTVVEWGAGLAEELAESWLDVRLQRWSEGGRAALASAGPHRDIPAAQPSPDSRVVSVRPHGPRWVGAPLRSRLLGAAPVAAPSA